MKHHYNFGSTIPGTRSYHHFVPGSENAIAYKTISKDAEFVRVHRFSTVVTSSSSYVNFKLYDYVACKYDSHWWIGIY